MLFGRRNSSIRALSRAFRCIKADAFSAIQGVELEVFSRLASKSNSSQGAASSPVTDAFASCSSCRFLSGSATNASRRGRITNPAVHQEYPATSGAVQRSASRAGQLPAASHAPSAPSGNSSAISPKDATVSPGGSGAPRVVMPEPEWPSRQREGAQQRGHRRQLSPNAPAERRPLGGDAPSRRLPLWTGVQESGRGKRFPPSPRLPNSTARHGKPRSRTLPPALTPPGREGQAYQWQGGRDRREAAPGSWAARAGQHPSQPLVFKGQARQRAGGDAQAEAAGVQTAEKGAGSLRAPQGAAGAQPTARTVAAAAAESAWGGDLGRGAGGEGGLSGQLLPGGWQGAEPTGSSQEAAPLPGPLVDHPSPESGTSTRQWGGSSIFQAAGASSQEGMGMGWGVPGMAVGAAEGWVGQAERVADGGMREGAGTRGGWQKGSEGRLGEREARKKVPGGALEGARLRKLQKLNTRIVRRFDALEEALKLGQLTPDEKVAAVQGSIAHMARALRQPVDHVNLATFMFRLSRTVTLTPLNSVRHRVRYMDVMQQLVGRFERHLDRQLHQDSWLPSLGDAAGGEVGGAGVGDQRGADGVEMRALATVMWACANMRYPLQPDQLDKMAGLAMTRLQQLSVDNLSMMLLCLHTYSGRYRPFEGRLMQVLAERAGQYHPLDFPPRSLLSVLSSLTALNSQLSKPTLNCLSLSALSQISHFDPPQLGALLSSLGKLCLNGRVESLPMGEKLFQAAAAQSVKQLDRFKPSSLSNLLYGFGVAKYSPGQEVLDAVAAYAEKNLGEFRGRPLANMVWALARMGYSPDTYADTGMPIYYVLNPRHPIHYAYADDEGYKWDVTPDAFKPKGVSPGRQGAAAAKKEEKEVPKRTLLRVVTVPFSKKQLREKRRLEEAAAKKREGLSDLGQRVAEALDRRESMQSMLRMVSGELLAVRDRVQHTVSAPTPARVAHVPHLPRGRSRSKSRAAAAHFPAAAVVVAAEPSAAGRRVDEHNLLALAGAILKGPRSGYVLDQCRRFPFGDPAGRFEAAMDPRSGRVSMNMGYDPPAIRAMLPSIQRGVITWDYSRFPEVPLQPRTSPPQPPVEEGPEDANTLLHQSTSLDLATETPEKLMAMMLRGVTLPPPPSVLSATPAEASSGAPAELPACKVVPVTQADSTEEAGSGMGEAAAEGGHQGKVGCEAGVAAAGGLADDLAWWSAEDSEGEGHGGEEGGLEEGQGEEEEEGEGEEELSVVEDGQLGQLLETGSDVGADAQPEGPGAVAGKLLSGEGEEEEEEGEGEGEEEGVTGASEGGGEAPPPLAPSPDSPATAATARKAQQADKTHAARIVEDAIGLAAMSPAKLKKHLLKQEELFTAPRDALERWAALPRATLDQLGDACAERINQFSPQELSSVLWAYATQRHLHTPLFKAAIARLEREGRLAEHPTQAVSIFAWSCAVLRERPPAELMDRMLGRMLSNMQRKGPQIQPICNMAWALAVFGYLDRDRFESLVKFLPQDPSSSQRIARPALCQLFQCTLHLEAQEGEPYSSYLPPPLLEQAQQAWGSRQTTTSLYQEDVQAVLMHMGVPFRSEFSPRDKFFAIDIAVKGKGDTNLAIEVDGPFHFTANPPFKLLASTDMRNRLLAKHGWLVVTVPCDHWKSLVTLQKKVEYLQSHVLSQIELSDEFPE